MHIKVMPSQIPQVWEHIKFGIAQIGEIPQEYLSAYCLKLLCDLLSEKAQCWVSLNEDRVLLNISVTKLSQNTTTDEKELYIEGFYAFQGTTPTTMEKLFALYQGFAKQAGCVRVVSNTKVPRACEILERHGFQPGRRTYTRTVEA